MRGRPRQRGAERHTGLLRIRLQPYDEGAAAECRQPRRQAAYRAPRFYRARALCPDEESGGTARQHDYARQRPLACGDYARSLENRAARHHHGCTPHGHRNRFCRRTYGRLARGAEQVERARCGRRVHAADRRRGQESRSIVCRRHAAQWLGIAANRGAVLRIGAARLRQE